MAWENTTRPRGVDQRTRRRILRRDGHQCQAPTHEPGCNGTATEVDHVIPWAEGGTDADANLRSLSHECHAPKTAQEAARGRARARQARPRTRPTEAHPGLT